MRNLLSSFSRTPVGATDPGGTRVQNTRRRRGRRRFAVAGSLIAVGIVVGTGLVLRPATTAQNERPATPPSESIGPQAAGLADHGGAAQARATQRAADATAAADILMAAEADRVAAEQSAADGIAAEQQSAADRIAAEHAAAAAAAAEAEAILAETTAPAHPSAPAKSQRDAIHRK